MGSYREVRNLKEYLFESDNIQLQYLLQNVLKSSLLLTSHASYLTLILITS